MKKKYAKRGKKKTKGPKRKYKNPRNIYSRNKYHRIVRRNRYIYNERPAAISKTTREYIYNHLIQPSASTTKYKNNMFIQDKFEEITDNKIQNEYIWRNKKKYPSNYIGKMDQKCIYCLALLFKNEKSSGKGKEWQICCRNGKVSKRIQLPIKPPPILHYLLTGISDNSKNFQKHILHFNNALKFCGSRMTVKRLKGRGIQKFILAGKVVHTTPNFNKTFNECKVYTYDPAEQLKQRLNQTFLTKIRKNPKLTHILEKLQELLIKHNWIPTLFKNVYTQYFKPNIPLKKCVLAISADVKVGNNTHSKNYAFPTSKKIASVIATRGEYNAKPTHQQFILTNINNVRREINETNGCCDPLAFPIFYPYGNSGYSVDMKKNYDISMRDYYRYLLMERANNIWNPFIHGKRLFEAWITNQWAKIQQHEMNQLKGIQPV